MITLLMELSLLIATPTELQPSIYLWYPHKRQPIRSVSDQWAEMEGTRGLQNSIRWSIMLYDRELQ